MSRNEVEEISKFYYNEAIRYMNNAKENLKKAGKEDNHYKDKKYVKTACGLAYNGILEALDGLFKIKEIKNPRGRKSKEFYHSNLAKMDKKLLNYFNSAYEILHLYGYYDGFTKADVIKSGFDDAYFIIEKIKY